MEGEGVTTDVRRWFDRPVPKPTVPRHWAVRAAAGRSLDDDPKAKRLCVWIGGTPVVESGRHGRARLILPGRGEDAEMLLGVEQAVWLAELIRRATLAHGASYPALQDVRDHYSAGTRGFDAMLRSAAWKRARAVGLLLV
jgi:hypothetical protein